MALYRMVVAQSTYVHNNLPNVFWFKADVPSLGAYTTTVTWVLNEAPYLLVTAGGLPPKAGQSEEIDIQFRLNGTSLGVFKFPRSVSRAVVPVTATTMIGVPRGILRLHYPGVYQAANVLNVELVPLGSPDDFYIGPVVCHYGA
jgi:hypothetical protein